MGYLVDGYKIMGKELAGYVQKHRAGIGTVVSVCGTIISNVLSTKAGAKSARQIDAKQMELGRTLTNTEKLKLCWANHIGSVGTAVVSCVGAGYSHNQHVKDFNKVATAYAGVKKLYDSARQATKEVLGEKKNMEVQDKINQKHLEENPEVKKQIKAVGPNPDPATMRKFWEPTSGITFYCTVDKINLALSEMRSEMKLLPKREKGSCLLEDKCILLLRLFDLLDVEVPLALRESETLKYMAFLKGKEENGSDDDVISAYFTPMLLDEDTMETCAAINWDTKPSDYRYGDYVKL